MAYVVYADVSGLCVNAFQTLVEAEAKATDETNDGSPSTADTTDRMIPYWFQPFQTYFDASEDKLVVEKPLTQGEKLTAMKGQLGAMALMFDNAIRSHWGWQNRAQSAFEVAVTLEDTRRLDNTFDWGRMWIGLTWLEILKLEGDTDAVALVMANSNSAALDLAGVQAVMTQALAELPNHDHISFWYFAHDPPNAWRPWFDEFKVYITQASGMGTTWNAGRYLEIPSATWDKMLVNYYGAARKYASGIGV